MATKLESKCNGNTTGSQHQATASFPVVEVHHEEDRSLISSITGVPLGPSDLLHATTGSHAYPSAALAAGPASASPLDVLSTFEPKEDTTDIIYRVAPRPLSQSTSTPITISQQTPPSNSNHHFTTNLSRRTPARMSLTDDNSSVEPPQMSIGDDESSSEQPSRLGAITEQMTELSLYRSQIHRPSSSGQQNSHSSTSSPSRSKKRLSFWEAKMVGRDEQFRLLTESLTRYYSSSMQNRENTKSHLVEISGESGTGKTRLAESLKSTKLFQAHENNPLFAQGKFDFLLRDEPYAGIIAACEDIAEHILKLGQAHASSQQKQLRAHIVDTLAMAIDTEELELLITMVPLMGQVLDINPLSQSHTNDPTCSRKKDDFIQLDNKKTQLQETFRRFMKVICQSFSPVVLCADDVQWADAESLRLLQEMLEPQQPYTIFCILLYRSNEVANNACLTKSIEHYKHEHASGNIDRTHILLGNLSNESVHLYLQDLLIESQPSSETNTSETTGLQGLTAICHQRTQGNIFFLNSFLTMLNSYGFLTYDTNLQKWTWDEKEIEIRTQSTNNVVELLMERMKTLDSPSCRELLRLAACLGSTCKESVLQLLWSNMFHNKLQQPPTLSQSVFRASLKRLYHEGFFQELNDGSYKWNHDQIRAAAIMLTPETERDGFHRRVGEALAHYLKEDLDSMIYVVAHLVSQGLPPEAQAKRNQYAELCLRASQRATNVAAFTNAKLFAEKGLSFLPGGDDKWIRNNQLCHELYMCLIQAERICGDIVPMEKHCNELIDAQSDKPISVRLGAIQNLYTGIFFLGSADRGKEGVEIGFKTLEQLGCRFPKGNLAINAKTIACLLSLKRMKSKLARTKGEVNLKMMVESDPPENVEESCRVIYSLLVMLYLCHDARLAIAVVRFLEYTFKYGVSVYAPPVFAYAAAILTGPLDDMIGASALAHYGLKLMQKVKYRPIVPNTLGLSYQFALHRTLPSRESAMHLRMASEIGLKIGDRELADLFAFNATFYRFLSGDNLPELANDCRADIVQMQQTKNDYAIQFIQWALRVYVTLLGEDTDEIMERIHSHPLGAPNADNPTQETDHFYIFFAKKMLGTYMGDFQVVAGISLVHSNSLDKVYIGTPYQMVDRFLRGLSCLVVARRSGARSLLLEGKRMLAMIKRWVKQGCPNVRHYEAIMSAELSAIKKRKRKKVMEKYQRAVDLALECGCVQDGALFYECWGLYALESLGAKLEAVGYIQQSIRLFTSWGAQGKVQKMRLQYGNLLRGADDTSSTLKVPSQQTLTVGSGNQQSAPASIDVSNGMVGA
ncbi:Transcriptional regulator [Seminavis robusta]|uniref:Transcriptional regulator n=1 Tax=Seminavis robusta TaxID=568900 RepID=A0A9N8EC35_9STRA|nr:Transcriptional regulator [Seminavis robusta]|eukprot:Sro952_g224090.1 Transcriptional regulator (1305) ;mRNA; r:26914-30980